MFKPNWSSMPDAALRQEASDHFKSLTKPFQDPDYPEVSLLPAWHGTSPEALTSILKAGYASLATTDSGFFGKGYYATYEAEYAYRVYSKGVLIFNWVATYSPLPVVNEDMKALDLGGRSHYGNYDAHWVHVRPRYMEDDLDNPIETVYWPCSNMTQRRYNEMVVFDSAAILPRYVVELESIGLKNPSPSIHSSISTVSTIAHQSPLSGTDFLSHTAIEPLTQTTQLVQTDHSEAKEIRSVIFPPYRALFKQYCEALSSFVKHMHRNPKQASAEQIQDFLVLSPTPFHVCVLIEALDWVAMALADHEKWQNHLEARLNWVRKWQTVSKSQTDWAQTLIPLCRDYTLFLRGEVHHDRSACDDHDRCLLVWGYSIWSSQEQTHAQKDFFKHLKKQPSALETLTGYSFYQLNQLNQSNRSSPAKVFAHKHSELVALIKVLQKSLLRRLPLDGLQTEWADSNKILMNKKESYQALLTSLQDQLKLQPKAWRWHALGLQTQQPVRSWGKQGLSLHGFFHLKEPFDPNKRLKEFKQAQQFSVIIGSTYFNADKPLEAVTTLCLDADYQLGETGATAGGYGHFSDPNENAKVHQAAYQTAKRMTRYARFYPDPQTLIQELQVLFNQVGLSVQYSFLHPEEAGTASCVLTRIFHTQQGSYLVAAGLGDALVAIVDSSTGQVNTVIKPRQYRRGQGPFTPLTLTEPWAKGHIQMYQGPISPQVLILRMTDGAWRALPHCVTEPVSAPDLKTTYLEYALDEQALSQSVNNWLSQHPNINPSNIKDCLQDILQNQIELKRRWLLAEQATLQAKLKAFLASSVSPSKVTLAEYAASEGSGSKAEACLKQLKTLFTALHLDPSGLESHKVSDLLAELDHVGLGDDLVLSVQAVLDQTPQLVGIKSPSYQ